jgi:hypothetical protein
LGVLAFALLGFWLLKPSPPSLKLAAMDMGRGQLRIAWDGTARPIGHARFGSMEIDDHGVKTQVNLTAADLRSGSISYARLSGDVAMELSVYVAGGPPVVETTRFLRPGESPMAPVPRADAAKKPEPERPAEAKSPAPLPPPPIQLPAPAASARTVTPFRAPVTTLQEPSTDVPSIAPPSIENAPAAPPANLTSVLGPAPAPAAAPPRPSRPANAPPVASGRIIWTGRLAKNGRLVLESNHASSGAITGALPAGAVRASAYPGDLTADGITLFTADPRYSQPLTEKAGAENGWNSTTYTLDPKRAAGLKVVEQPGPQNGYKLVLESDIPKLSVVVVEWRATQ